MNLSGFSKVLALLLFSFIGSLLISISETYAQSLGDDDIEVYLSFRYRGVVNNVVIAVYREDQFYLPVTELFTYLEIDRKSDFSNLSVSGNYLADQTPYEINFDRSFIEFGDSEIQLTNEDFLITDFDFYLKPKFFEEIFGLAFDVDFNNLALNLDTDFEVPVLARVQRAQKRQLADANRFQKENYPIRYGREKPIFDFGFVDYNLGANISDVNIYNYSTNVGMQLLGGDLQGTAFGTRTENFNSFITNNLRWRYFFENNRALTNVIIGQTSSNGLLQNAYTGIRITNELIEPRVLYDEYIIEGQTTPESEIELYLNNLLVDFTEADQLGNYRFSAPMTYGTSQFDLRIFGPSGSIQQQTRRIQIPFSFIPEGELNYNVNYGQLDNPIIGSTSRDYLFQSNAMYGISNWLTGQFGVEYINSSSTKVPTISGKISSRIYDKYIFTLEGSNNAFVRSSLSAVYTNTASFRIDYTNYLADNGVYNVSGDNHLLVTNFFHPINLLGQQLNFRLGAFTRYNDTNYISNFRVDANTRLSRMNMTLGYSDRLINTYNFLEASETALLRWSLTYNFSRSRDILPLFRGAFIRSRLSFLPTRNEIESFNSTISRNIFSTGRLQLTYSRNFLLDFNSFRVAFVIDFNRFRSNTTAISGIDSYSINQNIRGSIGYDSQNKRFLLTSREQVGQAASSIKLFVDNNGNGIFDGNDEEIKEKAVRIDRIGSSLTERDGLLYFTQMRPYSIYNMEINSAVLSNPLLVPEYDNFAIITDPNRFKKIEIPFYMSGVVEGIVEKDIEGRVDGVAGLKLILENKETDEIIEVRTYSDGSYYEYPIRPGDYNVRVDKTQLETILQLKSIPDSIDFTVKAIEEGDFIDGLNFKLVPLNLEEVQEIDSVEVLTLADITDTIRSDSEILEYSQEIFETIDLALRYIIRAQNAFYSKNVNGAFRLVNESLELFETAQGHALKGSFYYFEGNIEQAQRHWEQALRFNPDLYIPDMETLEERVTTSASD